MTALRTTWSAYLDQQHRYPTGLVGQLVGERMVRQHTPETIWSIALLNLQPTDCLLEIGCGAGQGLAIALKLGSPQHMIGLDLSATMLQSAARRNQRTLSRGQVSLLRGDLAVLPFRSQRFEKIVSIHTFYFWSEPRAIFDQIVGLLAPGGRSVTTFATAHTTPTGEHIYWPLHERAETLVSALAQESGIRAAFTTGPDSRQFNNVAIVIDKR